jgi:hypothetical protein
MQILFVVRGAGVLCPSLGRVDPQVSFLQQSLGQLDQPGIDRQQAQFGTRKWKDLDSVELVVAVALVTRVRGVVESVCRGEDHVEFAHCWS